MAGAVRDGRAEFVVLNPIDVEGSHLDVADWRAGVFTLLTDGDATQMTHTPNRPRIRHQRRAGRQ